MVVQAGRDAVLSAGDEELQATAAEVMMELRHQAPPAAQRQWVDERSATSEAQRAAASDQTCGSCQVSGYSPVAHLQWLLSHAARHTHTEPPLLLTG